MYTISLTSIPPRFSELAPVLKSLRDQSQKPQSVELWISRRYRRFPDWEFAVPEVPEGVTVRITDYDYGPATKILPAALDRRDSQWPIIYCDDDGVAPSQFAASLLKWHKIKPDHAIANRGYDLASMGMPYRDGLKQPRAKRLPSRFDLSVIARRIQRGAMQKITGEPRPKPVRNRQFFRSGFVDIAEGVGGVLITPQMLPEQAFDVPDEFWMVDDIWLSGMLKFAGVSIFTPAKTLFPAPATSEKDALLQQVINGMNRIDANLGCAQLLRDRYKIWTG